MEKDFPVFTGQSLGGTQAV